MVSPMKKVGRKSRSMKKVGRKSRSMKKVSRKSRSMKKVKGVKKSNEIRFRFYRCAGGCEMVSSSDNRRVCKKCGHMAHSGLY